jgi:hypothetical protein
MRIEIDIMNEILASRNMNGVGHTRFRNSIRKRQNRRRQETVTETLI